MSFLEKQIFCPRCDHQSTGRYFANGFTCQACGVVRKTSFWGDPIATFGDAWHGAGIGGRVVIAALVTLMAAPFVAFIIALILSVTHAHP